jgi:hypothetical protein
MKNIFDKHSDRQLFAQSFSGSVGECGMSSPKSVPIICTEFGGLNIRPASGHETNEGDWGYITAENPDDLLKRLEGLCMGIVDGGFVSGFVYTQLYDDDFRSFTCFLVLLTWIEPISNKKLTAYIPLIG